MSLGDLFSQDISPKYNKEKYSKDFNKNLIENILNNKCNDTIAFCFKMTLREWIDLFTRKKSVKDIIIENHHIYSKTIVSEKIEKSLVGIDKLLNSIKKKNDDEDYLTHFIMCLYNYERWFSLKQKRNNKK